MFFSGVLRDGADMRPVGELKNERECAESDHPTAVSTSRADDPGGGDGVTPKLGRIERQTLLLTARANLTRNPIQVRVTSL